MALRITRAVPVLAYPPPAYPSREEARPRLLLRCLPPRWRKDRLLLTLLVGTLPGASGCAKPAAGVAPVFEHGEGIGWFGCEVIVPPVFLSEAEAMAVVRDELAAAGLTGLSENLDLADVEVGVLKVEDCGDGVSASTTSRVPFEGDLVDEEAGLVVETLTDADFSAWAVDGDPGCESSVDTHDLHAAAEVLGEQLDHRGAGRWYGVLYDPVVSPDGDAIMDCWYEADPQACEEELEAAAKVEGEALLRAQVQDLVAWMRENGLL